MPASQSTDFLALCLALAVIPSLQESTTALRYISNSAQGVKVNNEQLSVLIKCIAQLLCTLDAEFHAGRWKMSDLEIGLVGLNKLLRNISIFVQMQASYNFLKTLYVKERRVDQLEVYLARMISHVKSFRVLEVIHVEDWQSQNANALAADHRILTERLDDLEGNQQRLAEILGAQQSQVVAIMVSLQKRLANQSGSDRDRRFFSHCLHYLSMSSEAQVPLEDWMITSYKVDFGKEIGSGGFGHVFKGTWNKTDVTLKVLRNEAGVTPSAAAIHSEIKTWSKIRHPNILQFLGANVLDERPFMVMPYMRKGNVREYLEANPGIDRIKILHDILLGLVHLHSQQIVHGDLKALNILIDDGNNAVLCDFGLSWIIADATSRTTRTAGAVSIVGSRNWMAPERILGGSLRKPSDIYAFSMTLFEVFTLEIPLGHINHSDFIELVVRMDVRPEQPEEHKFVSSGLTDAIWEVAEHCWKKSPSERPTADSLCDTLHHLLEITQHNAPAVSSSALSTTLPTVSNQRFANEAGRGTPSRAISDTQPIRFSSPPPLYSPAPISSRLPVFTSATFEPAPEKPAALMPRHIYAGDMPSKQNSAGSSTGDIEDTKSSRNSVFVAAGTRAADIYMKAAPPSASNFKASVQSLETPETLEDWNSTFSTALASQNPRRLREVLARSNPEFLLPAKQTSPLSQSVILGLLHHLALAVYKAQPKEDGLFELALQPGKHGSHLFKQTLWWMQRTSAALDGDTAHNDHALFSEVCRIVPDVQRMLTTTKRRCNSLPEGHPVSKEADTIFQIQAIINRNLGQNSNTTKSSYICINPSFNDIFDVPLS